VVCRVLDFLIIGTGCGRSLVSRALMNLSREPKVLPNSGSKLTAPDRSGVKSSIAGVRRVVTNMVIHQASGFSLEQFPGYLPTISVLFQLLQQHTSEMFEYRCWIMCFWGCVVLGFDFSYATGQTVQLNPRKWIGGDDTCQTNYI
jgi:hypothetical protein